MTTYTIANLKKMNTERLQGLFVKLFGAFPADPFHRGIMIVRIWDIAGDADEKAAHEANMINENSNMRAQFIANVNTITRQMVNEKEGTEERSLRDSDVIAIIAMYQDGLSTYAIGKMFGKGAQYIKNIVSRKLYKDVKLGWNYVA